MQIAENKKSHEAIMKAFEANDESQSKVDSK